MSCDARLISNSISKLSKTSSATARAIRTYGLNCSSYTERNEFDMAKTTLIKEAIA
jgi:hypothetical protein